MKTKRVDQSAIKAWIKQALTHNRGHARSVLNNLSEKGIDLDTLIDSMSAKQAKVVLHLMSLTYSLGCSQTRKHFAQMKADQKRWSKEKSS